MLRVLTQGLCTDCPLPGEFAFSFLPPSEGLCSFEFPSPLIIALPSLHSPLLHMNIFNPFICFMQETWVRSLSWEDPLEKGKAIHSSILAWRIPWTIESTGSQRVGHD